MGLQSVATAAEKTNTHNNWTDVAWCWLSLATTRDGWSGIMAKGPIPAACNWQGTTAKQTCAHMCHRHTLHSTQRHRRYDYHPFSTMPHAQLGLLEMRIVRRPTCLHAQTPGLAKGPAIQHARMIPNKDCHWQLTYHPEPTKRVAGHQLRGQAR